MKAKFLSIIVAIFSLTFIQHCAKKPSDVPLPLTGSIQITAHIDAVPVDSFFVMLDNVAKGLHPNGCVFENIEAGKHQVVVSKKDTLSPIDFASVPKLVAVKAKETTDVALVLTKLAPNFTLKNLDNEDITLENYQNKVVLLVFYSHT